MRTLPVAMLCRLVPSMQCMVLLCVRMCVCVCALCACVCAHYVRVCVFVCLSWSMNKPISCLYTFKRALEEGKS